MHIIILVVYIYLIILDELLLFINELYYNDLYVYTILTI